MHYYLQKGIAPDTILGLSNRERSFYTASMMLGIEEKAEEYNAILGGNGGK